MPQEEIKPNSGRKLFFGLFVFPLLIAIGMAVLLCSVVLLTNEHETPETLIAAIKTGSPNKRWQKAFELSNELNRSKKNASIRSQSVLDGIIYVLRDPSRYDSKTRGYMAIALSHFNEPAATQALRNALTDEDKDVRFYSLWALGVQKSKEAIPDVLPFLDSSENDLKEMAVYVLGVMGDKTVIERLRPLLNDPIVDIRWNTALSLARLGDDAGLEVLLKMLERQTLSSEYKMNDAQIESVMINATKGIALIRKPQSLQALESIARSDKSLKVRQSAIDAMEYIKS